MTTETTTNENAATPAKEPKTVAKDMAARKVLANPTEAAAYLNNLHETLPDIAKYPLASPGVDAEGNFDPAIYNDSTEVLIAKLRNAGTARQKAAGLGGGVKAIVCTPIPTLDALLARADGREWIQSIIHKELNHVAVRALREAADVSTVIDQMPTTIEGFITSGRESSASIMESFNELYKIVNDGMAKQSPVWNRASRNLIKSEFKKALESKGYALEFFTALEDRGEGKPSLFAIALTIFINLAKKKGLDSTIFERWAATRDAKVYDGPSIEDEDDDSFDFDSILADAEKPEGEAA